MFFEHTPQKIIVKSLVISLITTLFLFFSRDVFAISKIERMLKDHPVKFSFIIFGVCGVFVGVLLLLSYYKAIFRTIRSLITDKKKAPKRTKIPTGKFGDISLPDARLSVRKANVENKEFVITSRKEFWIGRNMDNQLILDGATVSRKHAKIRPQTDGYVIYDLNSKGGTFVNDKLIQSHIMEIGDVIVLAKENASIVFRKQGEETAKIDAKEKEEKKENILLNI